MATIQHLPLEHTVRPLRRPSPSHQEEHQETSRQASSFEQDWPKEASSQLHQEPPPAYAPPIRTLLQGRLVAAILASRPDSHVGGHDHPRQLQNDAAVHPVALNDASHEDEETLGETDLSPIYLRVCTRVNVARDNNVVALACSPAEQANSIAEAIIGAFKRATVLEGGLPMIDQDGRPRPVNIEVDAGITVEGSSNVVGTETAVLDIVRGRQHAAAAAAAAAWRTQIEDAASSSFTRPSLGGGRGRRRSADEVDDISTPAAKRSRNDE